MGGFDDIDELLAKSRRRESLERERDRGATPERPAERQATAEIPAPEATGHLRMERRQGVYRYTLLGRTVRSGDEVEFYVDRRHGWMRGRFLWGRTRRSEGRIRIEVEHPTAADEGGRPLVVGELELTLPDDALCRWPADEG